MELTHLGHACLLVRTGAATILFDPGSFSDGFAGLRELSAIVVTHQHADHLDVDALPALLAGNPDVRLITDPQTAEQLRDKGISADVLAAGDTVTLGSATLEGVGGEHAVIHGDIPRVGNTGVVVRSADEPTLFHPGDMIDTVPAGVDVLALPISAPWCALKETVDFARAVAPHTAVPIHDALLSSIGRGAFLRILGGLLPDGTTVTDLKDRGPTNV